MDLRYYQQACVNALFSAISASTDGVIGEIPTGGGKTPVIAELARRAIESKGRAVVLTHSKELIEQIERTTKRFGLAPSVYSAGLDRREHDSDLVIAGIQSIYRNPFLLGDRQLAIIDECHLVSDNDESMFNQTLAAMRQNFGRVRIVGFSATPYRLGTGLICGPDRTFKRSVYKVGVKELIDQRFLSKLITPNTEKLFETKGLKVHSDGEFRSRDVESVFSDFSRTSSACQEVVSLCQGKQSVLIFCSSVQQCYTLEMILRNHCDQDSVGVVEGDTPDLIRERLLADFKARELRFLINCNLLTVGFDAPNVDAIVLLRATASPGLLYQMVGRGLRLDDAKGNECLVLDYGDNFERHGPIDSPAFGDSQFRKKGGGGQAPDKQCPGCNSTHPATQKICQCGYLFPMSTIAGLSDAAILQKPEKFHVASVGYAVHYKNGDESNTPTLRLDYECYKIDADGKIGTMPYRIAEWICIEHEGWAGNKAFDWWREACPDQDFPIV